jgi:hypothetical protein
MRMRTTTSAAGGLRVLLLTGASLLAGACGYFGGSGAHKAVHAAPAVRSASQADPQEKALAGMVEAVGPSRSQLPVTLLFSIHARPQVGQDDEIDYAVVPNIPGIETLRLAFGSIDGLQVVSHGPLAAIKPASGVPILGSVTVRPARPGLLILTAVVAVQSPDQSVGWPFTIPVIVGEGPAQTASNQP